MSSGSGGVGPSGSQIRATAPLQAAARSNASLNKLSCCTHREILKGETIENQFFFPNLKSFYKSN